MNEDLLEAAISGLKANVDAVMYDINNMMSRNDYSDNMVEKMIGKIKDLSKANQSYQQAISLKAQLMKMKIEAAVAVAEDQKGESS